MLPPGAASADAFLARLVVAVENVAGFEELLAAASPLVRYGAFLRDSLRRSARSPMLRVARASLLGVLRPEAIRHRAERPDVYAAGLALLRVARLEDPDAAFRRASS